MCVSLSLCVSVFGCSRQVPQSMKNYILTEVNQASFCHNGAEVPMELAT